MVAYEPELTLTPALWPLIVMVAPEVQLGIRIFIAHVPLPVTLRVVVSITHC